MTGLNIYKKHQIMFIETENKAYWVHLLNQKIAILLKDASRHMKNNHHHDKNQALQKINQIIELALLDYVDTSHDVGKTLESFYSISLLKIVNANLTKSHRELDKLSEYYDNLSKSWLEISRKELL